MSHVLTRLVDRDDSGAAEPGIRYEVATVPDSSRTTLHGVPIPPAPQLTPRGTSPASAPCRSVLPRSTKQPPGDRSCLAPDCLEGVARGQSPRSVAQTPFATLVPGHLPRQSLPRNAVVLDQPGELQTL